MTSAAESLYEHARDEDEQVADLLSRAISFATILRQKPVVNWLKQELAGFEEQDQLPAYRRGLQGTLVAWMPGQGWIEAPVSNEIRASVSEFELRDGIRDLERAHAQNRRAGGQRLELPEARLAELQAQTNLDTRLNIAAPNEAIGQVIETVRLTIGLWAEALVEAGLTQDAASFQTEDRQKAEEQSRRLPELMAQAAEQAPERVAAMYASQGGFLSRLFGRA